MTKIPSIQGRYLHESTNCERFGQFTSLLLGIAEPRYMNKFSALVKLGFLSLSNIAGSIYNTKFGD
jgi:hypothetical protein